MPNTLLSAKTYLRYHFAICKYIHRPINPGSMTIDKIASNRMTELQMVLQRETKTVMKWVP